MELKTVDTSGTGRWVLAAFLGSLYAVILGTLGEMKLLPLALPGAMLVLVPRGKAKIVDLLPAGLLLLWLLFRGRDLGNGAMLLANRLFAKSQAAQAYEYDFFPVKGNTVWETVLWLSLMLGTIGRLWGRGFVLGLSALWVGAMAYFGVTPGIWCLSGALFCGMLTILPPKGRLGSGLVLGALILAITVLCLNIAPEPIAAVSRLDEAMRDALAFQSASVEQVPVPSQVPEPEVLPPEQVEQEQPDHGVQGRLVNVLFLLLAALTLAILFIPAVIRDRASKKAAENRAGILAEDRAEAIRAMFLYTMRWRALDSNPEPIPGEIYGIWQEAAFSRHTMEEEQREAVRQYLERTARSVWNRAGKGLRIKIRYVLCL